MSKPTVCMIHLGCVKNLIDTEKILGGLACNEEYFIAENPAISDIVIINTCGFIESARQEARETIQRAIKMKKSTKVKSVVVVGCMAQLYGEALIKEFPQLDGVVGFCNYDKISSYIKAIWTKKQQTFLTNEDFVPSDELRLRVTQRHFTYLRITEGCSNHCAYCMIPRIRGGMRSKPLGQILEEVKVMLSDGVKELIVIGQDTANYGRDLTTGENLYDLIAKVSEISGIRWIRLMYVHPDHIDERFVKIFALPKVIPYLEMPIQHVHPRILKEMGRIRDSGSADIKKLVADLRKSIPGLVLRTTVMVGFPGETEEEFETLLRFVQDTKFERLGAFMYSQEAGTKASSLPGQISVEVKQRRYDAIMNAQKKIAFEWAQGMVGRSLEVVVEEWIQKGRCRTRSYGESPEIDPAIYLEIPKATIGKFYKVKIKESKGYDLIASPISGD